MRESRDELSLRVFLRRPERRREPRRLPRGQRQGGQSPRERPAREPARAASLAPALGTRSQRSAVKVAYMQAGNRHAWRAHGAYLAREGAQREGANGQGFDATREDLDVAGTLGAWQEAGDRLLWKTIVSPEQAARLDLRAHARALVEEMGRDLGTRLEWIGIDHHNTDNPHLHLLIRGRDARGHPLSLDAQYVQRGIRGRSEELATRSLGLRTDRDIAASREQAIGRAQFTDLDRAILARADGNRRVAYGGPPPAGHAPRIERLLEMRRLEFLGTLGLVERVAPGAWTLSPQLEATLRQAQLAGDILKSTARHQACLSDPEIPLVVTPLTPGLRLEGRVVGMGTADAGRERRYLLLEGTDRRLHYILHHPGLASAWDAGRVRVGDRIVLGAHGLEWEGHGGAPLPTLGMLQEEQGRPVRVVPPLDGLVYRGQLLGYARDQQGHHFAVVDTGRDLSAFRTEERTLPVGREIRVSGHAVGEGGRQVQIWRLRGTELAQTQERVR